MLLPSVFLLIEYSIKADWIPVCVYGWIKAAEAWIYLVQRTTAAYMVIHYLSKSMANPHVLKYLLHDVPGWV